MDYKEQFERELPIINKDNDKIYIKTSNNCEGTINIINDGGGELIGKIMSNSRFISFEPEEFKGNDTIINFYINLDIYKPGEILKTSAVIMSNGGEYQIEFTIKIIPYSIETKEGYKISSLEDFYNYAKEEPIQSRQLFSNHEFMMWLYSSGYEYMDLYEKFILDPNKERALDNFLLLNGFKDKAYLKFINESIIVNIHPLSDEIYKGRIGIEKIGWGYTDNTIKNKSKWLRLGKDTLESSDFNEEGIAYMDFYIDPLKFTKRINYDRIYIDENFIEIKAEKEGFMEAYLDREYLNFSDNSTINIKSNIGETFEVNIKAKEDYIKLEGENFIINNDSKIPFTVEYPLLKTAQLKMSRQAVDESEIYIKASHKKRNYYKILRFSVGKF